MVFISPQVVDNKQYELETKASSHQGQIVVLLLLLLLMHTGRIYCQSTETGVTYYVNNKHA